MAIRQKTMKRLAAHSRDVELDKLVEANGPETRARIVRTAKFPPDGADGQSQTEPHAAAGMKRAIPKDYDYDPKALKPLARMLWALSVSLGHAMTAHRQFTKLKSATISPDGLIGGRGYVMAVKDIRKALHDACEAISSVSDTIHDEIHAPHWRPKLADLEKNDRESLERLVGDADKKLEEPEDDAEEEIDEAENEGEIEDLAKSDDADGEEDADADADGEASDEVESDSDQDEDDADDADDDDEEDEDDDDGAGDLPDEANVKTASYRVMQRFASSSLPVQCEPGGPRVQHLDRGDSDQTGPFGSYNSDEPPSLDDDWGRSDGTTSDYLYENNTVASSMMPDADLDPTPTEGWDFGIGYGEGNDAHGQGPQNYGISTDQKTSVSMLPQDVLPSVARSDYYDGDKGDNLVNSNEGFGDRVDLPGQAYRWEQAGQPHVRWSDTTHELKDKTHG